MGSELGVGVPASTSFAQALDALKREGSNVLLVGDEASPSHRRVCDRFLGPAESTQYRIVVITDRERIHHDGSSCRTKQTQYLVLDPDSHGVTDSETSSEAITELSVLGMVGREFVERVNAIESGEQLIPSALRVCVDSIVELLERYELEAVFRLLHVLTTRTRRSRGMGHYHLPLDRNAEAVRLFEPLFDAVVTLRSNSDGPKHRWYLRNSETTTDWIPL